MNVIKRDGRVEEVSFDKVLERSKKLSEGLTVNATGVAQKVLAQIYDGVKTTELDELASQIAANLATLHPDYGTLAARLIISNHQKNTTEKFSDVVEQLANQTMKKTGEKVSYISEEIQEIVKRHGAEIDARIDYERDFLFDYFGFKTLERAYLIKSTEGKILERPQHMWMRVALALWGSVDLQRAFETYDMMSCKMFTHATPTLFNAGTPRQQMSSCFLLAMSGDSIEGLYKTLMDCAKISKYAGGIGLHVHNVRAKGSLIRGTNGSGNGLVPLLRVYNNTARHIDQGGNKRNGSFAIYLEPWHADVEDFLRLKLNTGAEEERARDLFYAMWIPDLFMKRVEEDGNWTLFCPDESPGLADVYGEEFEALYTKYEAEGRGRKTVSAQKLWFQILDTQMETGTPYLLYKDAANRKSNQKNLGTIKSSNLCVAPETYILTDKGQYQISELAGQSVNVWNGDKWSQTTITKTGENQKLIKIILSDGTELDCTPYHKFIIGGEKKTVKMNNGKKRSVDKNINDATRIDAKDLTTGTKLIKWSSPTIEGSKEFDIEEPYTHGFFCGDGNEFTNGKGKEYKRIILCGEKQNLIPYLKVNTVGNLQKNGSIQVVIPKTLNSKFDVPINSTIDCRLKWLAGLLDADGYVRTSNKNTDQINLSSINLDFMKKVQLLLITLGIQVKLVLSRNDKTTIIRGKEYNRKPIYSLNIGAHGLYKLHNLGFKTHRLVFRHTEPQISCRQYVTVISVNDTGRTDDTYCFNEPENHAGVFNGILTGNCTEIIQYTDKDEISVCNLASMGLPSYVEADGKFNYEKLRKATHTVIQNLNRVIDINYYPVPEAQKSNMRHRPVGLGVQGLADVFALMKLSWDDPQAIDVNARIFEHMYYAAVEASVGLALEQEPYETFDGSPASQGKLQPDLWGVTPRTETDGTLDWKGLRAKVRIHGMRNSLLLAPMPTASTSQILGFNEAIEPFTSNLYTRRTLAGEYIMVNKYLLKELMGLGIWSEHMKQMIVANNGSVLGIPGIPEDIQLRYRTAWELKQKTLIDMAADRGAFVCQSQSLNLFVADATYSKLTSMHFYAWKKGLKTGCYYLRTKASVTAQKFTVDPRLQKSLETPIATTPTVAKEEPEQKRKAERRALAEKLAREYEEEQAKANQAAEDGTGCLMCSG